MSEELAEAPRGEAPATSGEEGPPSEARRRRPRVAAPGRPGLRRPSRTGDDPVSSAGQVDGPAPIAGDDPVGGQKPGSASAEIEPEVRSGRGSGTLPADGDKRSEEPGPGDGSTESPQAGGGEKRRRQRRRPSRTKSEPENPSETETQPPAPVPEAVRTASAAPAIPSVEEEAAPPVPGGPAVEQGQRTRLARRRRRGAPRKVRSPAVQPESGPLTMLISAGAERNQIAVLRERELIEHYVSHDEDRSIVGNIYVGRVQNVLPGMEAAFLDIGEAKNAVLYAGEVSYDEEVEGPPPRIESMLKSGQSVLAQVTKDPMGSKGARLTTEVSLAGRYVVLVPEAESMGISRRLPDEERKRLRDIASRVRPKGHGLIVRTAAEGVSEADLEGDIKRLARIWSEIDEKRRTAKPPKLVYSEPDLAIRGIRDLFTSDVLRVIVNDSGVFGQIRDYLSEVAPPLAQRVELYTENAPLFEKYGVIEQLRKAIDRKVWLKSGGHIVIDRTEAMTVIDVNTGRFVGKSNLETTVLHANLEAAEEIAKQLRLRDIGGIIVIDFIDMMHERNRQELVRTFEAALQRDKTRTQVFNISELGLLQMTRKNVSEGLMEAFSTTCETCEGRGRILSELEG